jgi:predicted acylesterase/phospholipase RssA
MGARNQCSQRPYSLHQGGMGLANCSGSGRQLSAPLCRAMRLGGLACIVAAQLMLAGCASDRYSAVPSALAGDLTFAQVENARFAGEDVAAMRVEVERAFARRRSHAGSASPVTYLALSAGQEDGAFGAGLLVGWSRHGGRPEFQIVTGTSTGALAAPFAFLGPEFDWALEAMYTKTGVDDIVDARYLVAAVNNDALMDTEPLARTIAKYLSQRVLQRIAEEYGKGRLLLISTTNLDSGKLVIWNIGAIAASENPDRLELVRKIILASAAVPGLFPPVMIDATLKDGRHQEMHVDGGTVSQMFIYPPSLDMAAIIKSSAKRKERPAAYIIRNGRVSPQPEEVERGTLQIAGRAITTMIASNAVGELYRIYTTTQRDQIDFKLALIEDDFTEPYKRQFDHGYMSKLFAYGLAKGIAGYAWQTVPPGYARTSQ